MQATVYWPRRPRRAGSLVLTALRGLAALAAAAGGAAAQGTAPAPRDHTPADVAFMQGMIVHHAQAVVMSDWAPTHGASPSVLLLCRRIGLSQRDEIGLMQRWLADRQLAAPDPLHMRQGGGGPVEDRSALHMPGMDMGEHPMMMAGMLSPAAMRQLDAARGPTFDRLYLTGMIKHHRGALDMVAKLFATPGGGQQPEISTFATDIDAGQRAEITRMETLLHTLTRVRTR